MGKENVRKSAGVRGDDWAREGLEEVEEDLLGEGKCLGLIANGEGTCVGLIANGEGTCLGLIADGVFSREEDGDGLIVCN